MPSKMAARTWSRPLAASAAGSTVIFGVSGCLPSMSNSRSADTSHSVLSLSRSRKTRPGSRHLAGRCEPTIAGHLVRCFSLGFIRMKGDMVHPNVEICVGGR